MGDFTSIANSNLGGMLLPPTTTANPACGADDEDGKQPRSSAKTDRFDPKRLRISQQYSETTPVEKKLTSVPVTKPNKQWWVRVHPDEDYRVPVSVIEVKDTHTLYLVEPSLVPDLANEVKYVTLYTSVSRDGTVFLWPVPMPDASGRPNQWNDSAREAAAEALHSWVRVVSNLAIGTYECWLAPGTLAEPEWPKLSFSELLSIAFKGDRFIDSLEHPVIGRLQGVK